MKKSYLLPFILAIDVFVLLYQSYILSLSYSEVHIFYGFHGIVGFWSHLLTPFLGTNDFSVRIPMIFLHIISVVLFYKLSTYYIKVESYRMWVTLIFILLPGVMSSAILLNNAGFVLFATLAFLYSYKRFGNSSFVYFLLGLYAFLDNSFSYLFLSLLFFTLYKKDYEFTFYNIVLIGINLFIFGTDIGGYPTGHFLDLLGVYAAVFSPLVFIYLFYSLYREFITKKLDILWFIASVPLLFSLFLSLRQRVHVEYYAPFVIIGLLIAARVFIASYNVRLPMYRKNYKLLFNISLIFLLLHFLIIVFNKELYKFIDIPKHHFAYKNYIAKELAENLKQNKIYCVQTDYKMQLRLEFYGINFCKKYKLSEVVTKDSKNVTVSYNLKPVYKAYVTKINKQ